MYRTCAGYNMPVVGRHAFIISDTGQVADVNAFTPDYEPMQLSIVDAAIQYDCPYDGDRPTSWSYKMPFMYRQ
jgi:hypothetical protein